MTEMVERVARGLCCGRGPCLADEIDIVCEADLHRDDARRAIEAMREPTEGMVGAGYDSGSDGYCSGDDGNWHEWRDYEPKDVYVAMIDEALK